MIQLQEIYSLSDVEHIYLTAFPIEERREVSDIMRLFREEPRYHVLGIFLDNAPVGLLSYWDFGEWVYGEHFAIDEACRCKGVGRQVLTQFLDSYDIILEVEPPTEEMAKRRIAFYERLGMTLSDMPYMQPPYRTGGQSIPLCLMTKGIAPSHDMVTTIHRVVYNFRS